MTPAGQNFGSMRLLVAVASYGQKNLPFLRQVIQSYQSMALSVNVIVFSDTAKELGSGVRVIVGLPCKNPWSLPFAHKAVFAENVGRYDLFIYSEDDIGVTEANLWSFLHAIPNMELDEIPGFLRYEVSPSGTKVLTDVHGAFHWRPESVTRRGAITVAEFSNEHAGFYILTQAQLKRAIASGGFLRAPYEGRYGLPETAATDPYGSCGFRKVICISELENFLIWHMSNLYISRHGISLPAFKEQVQTLLRISEGRHPATTLGPIEPRVLQRAYSKSYYETPSEDVLQLVPSDAKRVLSVGCGWGATEMKLKERGTEVTALPLDSVIGAVAARVGINVVYGTLQECLAQLADQRFDCVVVSHVVHLQEEPGRLLGQCSKLVSKGGTLVVSGPNFNRISDLAKRILALRDYGKLRRFDQSGISLCGPGTVVKHLGNTGLSVNYVRWFNCPAWGKHMHNIHMKLGSLSARDWVLQARR